MAAITLLASEAVALAQSASHQKARQSQTSKAQTPQANAAFEKAVKLGDEARLSGRLGEALDHYAKALQIRPTWADGWWNVGAILYEGDRYAEARDAFRNLVSLEPKRGPAWGMLGLCEFQTREYERAVVSLQQGRT